MKMCVATSRCLPVRTAPTRGRVARVTAVATPPSHGPQSRVASQIALPSPTADGALGRREAVLSSVGLALTTTMQPTLSALAAPSFQAGDGAEVQAYLPATEDGFYKYHVRRDRTPALRADALDLYSFEMPSGWKEQPVANAVSGNYCQPRCDEPTTEVKFANGKEGTLQVIIAPLTKLTRKVNASIDEIGDLSGVINSIGPYITGDFIEPDDVVNMKELNDNGKKYFVYELNTPYAMTGAYNIASVTTSQNELVLIVVSASEKQYNSAEAKLRRIAESFRV